MTARFGRCFLYSRYSEFMHRVLRDEVCVQQPGCVFQTLKGLRSGAGSRIQFGEALDMIQADGSDVFAAAHLPVLAGAVKQPVQYRLGDRTKWMSRP